MKPAFDCVLLVGFGGPTPGCCNKKDPCPGEAHCFVDGVLGNNPARAARVAEVARHYRHLGGYSGYNEATYAQGRALKEALRARGVDIPVEAAFRHWSPYVAEVMPKIAASGAKRVLAVILAPHQSSVSWDWYVKVVAESLDPLGKDAPKVEFLDPWWKEGGFVEACADLARKEIAKLGPKAASAEIVFTAHSIPTAIARTAPYELQLAETAAAVADRLGRPFSIAYQSGPPQPEIPWTSPDIGDLLAERAARGKAFAAVPVGFLCDNVEVLYDLDVAAREAAESRGAAFVRAPTVGTHPAFIAMIADRIADRCRGSRNAEG